MHLYRVTVKRWELKGVPEKGKINHAIARSVYFKIPTNVYVKCFYSKAIKICDCIFKQVILLYYLHSSNKINNIMLFLPLNYLINKYWNIFGNKVLVFLYGKCDIIHITFFLHFSKLYSGVQFFQWFYISC